MTDFDEDDDTPPWLIARWRDCGQRHIETYPPADSATPASAPKETSS